MTGAWDLVFRGEGQSCGKSIALKLIRSDIFVCVRLYVFVRRSFGKAEMLCHRIE